MTLDERLEFLVQSTESLHASVQELYRTVAEQKAVAEIAESRLTDAEERERKSRQAIIAAIQAYLSNLNGDGE